MVMILHSEQLMSVEVKESNKAMSLVVNSVHDFEPGETHNQYFQNQSGRALFND